MNDETLGNQSVEESAPEAEKRRANWGELILPFIVMVLVLLLDYLSKRYIESWLPLNNSWAPLPDLAHLFRITHVSNTGAAFGLFPGGSTIFMIVPFIVTIIIIIYNFYLPPHSILYRVALGLMMGGALGNLISRLRIGHVTDWLDFGPWPVFNIADLSIVSGTIILAILLFLEGRQESDTASKDSEEPPAIDSKKGDPGEDPSVL